MILPFLVTALAAILAFFRLKDPSSHGDLSIAQIEALREYVANDFGVSQPVKLRFKDTGFRFPDLANATQRQLDYQLRSRGVPYRYPIIDELPKDIPRYTPEPSKTYTIEPLTLTDDAGKPTYTEPVPEEDYSSPPSPEFLLDIALGGDVSVWLDSYLYKASMTYDLDTVHANDLPFYLAQTAIDYLFDIDLKAYSKRKSIDFEKYIPELTVHIVAAEDDIKDRSKDVENALKESITKHLEVMRPFVNITATFFAADVTKSKIPSHLMKNSTSSLTFVYSTTLEGFLNKIDDAHVYHLTQEPLVPLQGDVHGTDYLKAKKQNESPRVNITSFLTSLFSKIESRVGLTENSSNKHLEVHFISKAYTLKGIEAILDYISKNAGSHDGSVLKEVCNLIDTILRETQHDWPSHLKTTYSLYRQLTKNK